MSHRQNAEVFIVGSARTPIGAFMGGLSACPAPRLGAIAMKAAMAGAGCTPQLIEEIYMGNVLSAGLGQAPARQAAMEAGLSPAVPATTVNKVCGSGMQAVIFAARAILSGEREMVAAGGMESMSRAPHLLSGVREGWRMGPQQIQDSMVLDGLWDPYSNQHMGKCAEECARKYQFTREAQDAYAVASFQKARAAQQRALFDDELAQVEITDARGKTAVILRDEGPDKVVYEKVSQLKPVFDKQGTITPANASTINDGAAALVLASAQAVSRHGLKPLARIVAWGGHAQEPLWFTTAPVQAMRNVAQFAGWNIDEVDAFEVNEAFAVVAMAAMQELGIPDEKLNVRGGAIALGHPIGASGARLVVTLLSILRRGNLKRGIASLCIGGGEGLALAIELPA